MTPLKRRSGSVGHSNFPQNSTFLQKMNQEHQRENRQIALLEHKCNKVFQNQHETFQKGRHQLPGVEFAGLLDLSKLDVSIEKNADLYYFRHQKITSKRKEGNAGKNEPMEEISWECSDDETYGDDSELKNLVNAFTSIIHKYRFNTVNLSTKLGMCEGELIKFLSADTDTLESVRRIIKKWVQNFVLWIDLHQKFRKDSTTELRFPPEVEDILKLDLTKTQEIFHKVRQKDNNTGKRKKSESAVESALKFAQRKHSNEFNVVNSCLIGDLIEAKDDSGTWHPVKVVDINGTQLTLSLKHENKASVNFSVDIENSSSYLQIPTSTVNEIRRRQNIQL